MTRWTSRSVLFIIFLLMPLTWTQGGAPTETNKPLNRRLRRLNQQFERISRELRAFKETSEISLNSLKSWNQLSSRQKRTKRLDSSLANMTRALRENNHLNLRQIHMQKTVLSHKIQNQQSHIGP
ncbi:unnamed protein product [Leuciscus chuanchicus]